MMIPCKILVVGGGPAGVFAAIEARRRDQDAAVTLISEEPCEPYERPPLSKAVLPGKASAADAPIAGPKGLAGHGVKLECGNRCTAIDGAAREIVTASGRQLGYDALVIATPRWCAKFLSSRLVRLHKTARRKGALDPGGG